MQTHITTFYSFKGGVGRSLLLANVGTLLAQQAAPVLLWDLDLEAPGLHHIPALRPKPVPKAGFLEWLHGRGERLGQSPSAAELNRLWKSVKPVPGREGLFILPACGDKADFAGLYQSIAWQGPMVEQPEQGLNLFRSLLAQLAEKGNYAHILLDARTGVTDLGGLMAAVLPHATVLVGGYGRQNRAGLLQVYRALQPAVDDRLPERGVMLPLARLLVTSPVPDLPERRDECRRSWREDFVLAPEATQFEIPFDGRLLFEERLLAIEEPASPAGLAYRQIADALAGLRDANQHMQKQANIAAETHDDPRRLAAGRVVRGQRFEERVARLLTLLDYRVEPEQYLDNANKVDLIARKSAGFRQECFLVECKDWEKPVPKSELERFRSWLNGPQALQMHAEGLYVAHSYTREALSYAKSQGLIAVTPPELEAQLFDFRPYLDRLRRRFEESPLARYYVAQRVLLESEPEQRDGFELIEHAQAWVNGAGRKLWLVLGDYGTGKSSFFRRFAYELAKQAIQDANAPVPLAIDLKEYPNAISLETLLQEHLRKELNWHGNPEILLYLLAAGRVTLLLDAFDEMGTAALARSVEDQFRQLVRPTAQAGEGARCNRVLITCRTHFFRDQQQVKDVAGGHADDLVGSDSPLGQLARQFDASIDELMLFNDAQIEEFLCRHLGEEKARETLDFIRRTYDLESLAPRPMLLDMIVQALAELMQAGGEVTPAKLYFRYTDQWLKDNSGGKWRTSSQQRLKLLETLAQTLWGLPEHRIHYHKLGELVHGLPDALRYGIDPQRIDLELRTAAFLTRTADGFYGFSHKSFHEYFFARALLRALRDGVDAAAAVLETARVTPEMTVFLRGLMVGDDEKYLTIYTNSILSSVYRSRISENSLLLSAFWVRGGQIVDQNEAYKFWKKSCLIIPDALNMQGANLDGADLSFVSLCKANFNNASLRGVRFYCADLHSADFGNCNLDAARFEGVCIDGADFNKANLSNVSFVNVNGRNAVFDRSVIQFVHIDSSRFIGASFVGCKLAYSVIVSSSFSDANFSSAECLSSRFVRVRFNNVDWTGAELKRVTGVPVDAKQAQDIFKTPQKVKPYVREGASGSVNFVAFSPDGQFLLTASDDCIVRMWDINIGFELRKFSGHRRRVNSVAFSQDGSKIITASADGCAFLYNFIDCGKPTVLRGHQGPVNFSEFSHDGEFVVTAGADGNICIWSAHDSKVIKTFDNCKCPVNSVLFSKNDDYLIAACADYKVRILDVVDGKRKCQFNGHKGPVNSAVFLSDAKKILTASADGVAQLWSVVNQKPLVKLEGHLSPVNFAKLSPDESVIVTAGADKSVRLWDAVIGKEKCQFNRHDLPVNFAVFSPDGKYVATAGADRKSYLWDPASGKALVCFDSFSQWIRSAVFSPDCLNVATGCDDGSVRLWSLTNNQQINLLREHKASVNFVAFSPDGLSLASAGADRIVIIWDMNTKTVLRRLEGHKRAVLYVEFSPDGKFVVTASADRSAIVWNFDDGRILKRLEGHEDRVHSACFSPNANEIMTASDDGTVCIWEVNGFKEKIRLNLHKKPVNFAAFSPNASCIATVGGDMLLCIYDMKENTEPKKISAHEYSVNSVKFSHDGKLLITSGDNGSACIWNVQSGEKIREFSQDIVGQVWFADFSSDDKMVLTTGADSCTRLWDIEKDCCILRFYSFRGDAEPGWLTLDAQDRYRGNAAGIARLSYVDPDDTSLMPTHWLAEDLPHLQAPDPEAPGGD